MLMLLFSAPAEAYRLHSLAPNHSKLAQVGRPMPMHTPYHAPFQTVQQDPDSAYVRPAAAATLDSGLESVPRFANEFLPIRTNLPEAHALVHDEWLVRVSHARAASADQLGVEEGLLPCLQGAPC